MPGRRSYGQGCPVAHALDLVGERWALLVVRELRLGARRYSDLQAALPGIGPAVLSQRLRDLERVGVLRRRTLPPPAGVKVYELTEWGAELEPVFRALARWGANSPVVPLEGDISSDTVMLGLRTFFRPAGDPWTATYEVWIDRDRYDVRVRNGELVRVARGDVSAEPDAVVRADRHGFLEVLNGETTVRDAVRSGRITVQGDVDAVQRLVDARRLPAAFTVGSAPDPTPDSAPAR